MPLTSTMGRATSRLTSHAPAADTAAMSSSTGGSSPWKTSPKNASSAGEPMRASIPLAPSANDTSDTAVISGSPSSSSAAGATSTSLVASPTFPNVHERSSVESVATKPVCAHHDERNSTPSLSGSRSSSAPTSAMRASVRTPSAAS